MYILLHEISFWMHAFFRSNTRILDNLNWKTGLFLQEISIKHIHYFINSLCYSYCLTPLFYDMLYHLNQIFIVKYLESPWAQEHYVMSIMHKILQEEFINTFIIVIVWLEKHFPPFDNTLQWIILYNFTFTYTLYISIEKYFRSFQPQFSGVYVLKLYYYTLNFYL